MLIVDDILAAPFRGLFFIVKEIHKAVRKEQEAEANSAMAALADLHRRLEKGQLREAEFEIQEAKLLEKINRLGRPEGGANGDDEADTHAET